MDKDKKRYIGILSFVPLVLLLAALTYSFSLLDGSLMAFYHRDANSTLSEHYTTLMWLYGIAAAAVAAMLLYLTIHIARIKNMNSASKALWICVLVLLMPVSFPLFWYLQIRREPRHLATKADIA